MTTTKPLHLINSLNSTEGKWLLAKRINVYLICKEVSNEVEVQYVLTFFAHPDQWIAVIVSTVHIINLSVM